MPARRPRRFPGAGPRHERAVAAALEGVRALVNELQQSARSIERGTGLSNAQLFLLHTLAADGPLSQRELAERSRTQQSTVSVVVRRLERAHLVSRHDDPTDARKVLLDVTPRGRALARQAPRSPTDRLLSALHGLPAADLEQFAAGCQALCGALDLVPADAPMLFEGTAARGARLKQG